MCESDFSEDLAKEETEEADGSNNSTGSGDDSTGSGDDSMDSQQVICCDHCNARWDQYVDALEMVAEVCLRSLASNGVADKCRRERIKQICKAFPRLKPMKPGAVIAL